MRHIAHLQLSIDVDSDPISGSVSNGNGHPDVFRGWIELVSAIEAARAGKLASKVAAKSLGSFPGANPSGV